MKKQKRQLVIMILLLALLVGAFYGLRAWQSRAPEAVETEGDIIIDVAYEDVVNLIYEYEGETYHYEKTEDTWYLAEDYGQNVRQYRIKAMLAGVTPLEAVQTIENVTDLSLYGLEEPQRTIIFDTAIQRFQISVGDSNGLTSSYYIQLKNEPDKVYVVDQSDINRFNFGSEDIIEAEEEENQQE